MSKQNKPDQGRRELLKGLSTAAVVGAVAAGVSKTAIASDQEAKPAEEKSAGYHETQHIRDYYETL